MTPAPARDAELERIVEFARAHLDMDVAYVAEFTGGRQIYRALRGDYEAFGMRLGAGPPLSATYCQRVVNGRTDGLISDTRADPAVADLEVTEAKGIGSYVGVPIRTPDGRLYGTFCCLSRQPHPELDERDLRFLRLLADVIAERFDAGVDLRRSHDTMAEVIAGEELDVALQPIISMLDGHWSGVEALARFPTLGGPTEAVFARAHEVGLGPELELLALRKSLEHLPAVPDDVYMSVNIGPAGLLTPVFTDIVRQCDDLSRLVLELTEHASVKEYSKLATVLDPLRRDGMRLAVDDVGAGYSSLRHILQMTPDVIKIDRSLVGGIAGDAARRTIVTSVVLLSLDLEAAIVAEGVESMDDAMALGDLGVDDAQGYLFARPTTDPDVWQEWTRRRMRRTAKGQTRWHELAARGTSRVQAAGK